MLRHPALIPLSRQHHDALVLCVLTGRSLQADASPSNIIALTRRAIDFHELELKPHFDIEEQTLFPAIRGDLGNLPLIDQLIADHRALDAMIPRMQAHPSESLLKELTGMLRNHIRREESELFEDIQNRLAPDILQEVGRKIDAQAVRICHHPLL